MPLNVFGPASVNVPVPALFKPPLPLRTPERPILPPVVSMVALPPDPEGAPVSVMLMEDDKAVNCGERSAAKVEAGSAGALRDCRCRSAAGRQ